MWPCLAWAPTLPELSLLTSLVLPPAIRTWNLSDAPRWLLHSLLLLCETLAPVLLPWIANQNATSSETRQMSQHPSGKVNVPASLACTSSLGVQNDQYVSCCQLSLPARIGCLGACLLLNLDYSRTGCGGWACLFTMLAGGGVGGVERAVSHLAPSAFLFQGGFCRYPSGRRLCPLLNTQGFCMATVPFSFLGQRAASKHRPSRRALPRALLHQASPSHGGLRVPLSCPRPGAAAEERQSLSFLDS